MKLSDIFKSETKPQGDPLQVHIFTTDDDYASGLDLRRILAKSDKCPIRVMAGKSITLGDSKIDIVGGRAQVIGHFSNGLSWGEIHLSTK